MLTWACDHDVCPGRRSFGPGEFGGQLCMCDCHKTMKCREPNCRLRLCRPSEGGVTCPDCGRPVYSGKGEGAQDRQKPIDHGI